MPNYNKVRMRTICKLGAESIEEMDRFIFDVILFLVAFMEDGNTQVQVVSWYDNENSYTSQMVRTIKYFSELA